MNNQKKIKRINIIVISIIVIVLLLSIVNAILNSKQKNKEMSNEEFEEISNQEENEANIETEKNMTERDRIDYYFSIFLGYIEEGKFEKAYELLYPDFKKNYFPSQESFEKYINNYFPISSGVKYDNIERLGNIYILWVELEDLMSESSNNKFDMNVCIEEYGFNDFKLSFSVDSATKRHSGNY